MKLQLTLEMVMLKILAPTLKHQHEFSVCLLTLAQYKPTIAKMVHIPCLPRCIVRSAGIGLCTVSASPEV